MAKRIIFIHGRGSKPAETALQTLWYNATRFGLERDFGSSAADLFQNTAKDFVYYGDLSNTCLKKPEDSIESRQKSFEDLCRYSSNSFTKKNYRKVSKAGFLLEGLADTFSAALGGLRVAEPLISIVAPDIKEYWNPESYFGSDIRYRLTTVIKQAFDANDDIMIVAHSLGSMITYDTLWKFSHYSEYRYRYGKEKNIDLLVTLGSPLGDENVKNNLKGSQSKGFKRYPTNIRRWVNIAAEDDYVAHDSKLSNDFRKMHSLNLMDEKIKDCQPVYNLAVKDGRSNPHSSLGYLINPEFTKVLYAWLNN